MLKIIYRDENTNERVVIAKIMTNRSMSAWEALEAANIDMDEFATERGWDGWDPLALELEEK